MEKTKNTKRKQILITIAVIVAAVLVIGLAVYNTLTNRGYFLRNSVAAQSEHFTVSGPMMNYFFYSNYYQYAPTFATYMGLKTNQSLKSQTSPLDTNSTWFDYFANLTSASVKSILALCEAAQANGVALDEADQAAIEENMEELRKTASDNGYSMSAFLLGNFGAGVQEDDVRESMKLNALAAKYAQAFNDGLQYTDADYDAYYTEHKTEFDKVDVLSFTLKLNDLVEKDADGNPTGNVNDAQSKLDTWADDIVAADSRENFIAAVKQYQTTVLLLEGDSVTGPTEKSMNNTAGDEAAEWAFAAQTGDTKKIAASAGSSVDVYYLEKSVYCDETPTRNVRHILLKSDTYGEKTEAKAQAVYAEWEKDGFSLDAFLALEKTYNEDDGSIGNGGLYENVKSGDMVASFNDWLFDAERKTGDHGMVESDYGWHIMYYAGEGMAAWRTTADNSLRDAAYQEMVEANSTTVTVDAEVLYSINA